jgi:hypothetical protein
MCVFKQIDDKNVRRSEIILLERGDNFLNYGSGESVECIW